MDKVQNGTPQGNKTLCITCRHAQNITGIHLQHRIVCLYAYNKPVEITFPVNTCSGYDDKRMPSFYNMEKIAWEVSSRLRGPAGFGDNAREVTITPPKENNQPSGIPPTGKIQDNEREK